MSASTLVSKLAARIDLYTEALAEAEKWGHHLHANELRARLRRLMAIKERADRRAERRECKKATVAASDIPSRIVYQSPDGRIVVERYAAGEFFLYCDSAFISLHRFAHQAEVAGLAWIENQPADDDTVRCECCGRKLDPADAVLNGDEMLCCDCDGWEQAKARGLKRFIARHGHAPGEMPAAPEQPARPNCEMCGSPADLQGEQWVCRECSPVMDDQPADECTINCPGCQHCKCPTCGSDGSPCVDCSPAVTLADIARQRNAQPAPISLDPWDDGNEPYLDTPMSPERAAQIDAWLKGPPPAPQPFPPSENSDSPAFSTEMPSDEELIAAAGGINACPYISRTVFDALQIVRKGSWRIVDEFRYGWAPAGMCAKYYWAQELRTLWIEQHGL